MEFTYQAYADMINTLHNCGYSICNYHNYAEKKKCVILRHDIDSSIEAALRLGEVEETLHVSSTYFLLLTSNFYNPASKTSRDQLKKLQNMGHEIGLHFDEVAYDNTEDIIEKVQKEAALLSNILETPVTTVSMHRPSKITLEANYAIPGMVNSYGQTFFHDFKYLSDSRRRWREPVMDIIRSGEYNRLHILTHAFWYHEDEESIETTVGNFIRLAVGERYDQMMENITDLPAILSREVL